MKIIFEGEFKSLNSFESDELNDFTVITGKNGSGKTQLVKLFENKSQNNLKDENSLKVDSDISSIQIEGISSSYTPRVGADNWSSKIKPLSDKFSRLRGNLQEFIYFIIQEEISIEEIDEAESIIDFFSRYDEKFTKDYFIKVISESNSRLRSGRSEKQVSQKARSIIASHRDLIAVLKKICEVRDCQISDVKSTYFTNTPLPERFFDQSDLFNSRLQDIFYAYAKRRHLNEIEYLRGKEYGWDLPAVSDNEFVKENAPPWETINKILEDHDINYYFEGVDKQDFSPDSLIEFSFRKKSTDTSIRFDDLSSGEEVIIGMIIKLFTSEFYEESLEYPDLIVLDEPDAHLHPEMSKLLIDVLNQTFVRDYGIKIIMTTHSPSTVALTPEESVYQLSNEPKTELKKVQKDDALALLTEYIPTLSIDYKNHKQVFVESPTDRKYYQLLTDKLIQEKKLEGKLYFVSNSSGKGNCNEVISIVKQLRNAGNDSCFGIIDWDKTNKNKGYVFVHGKNYRYSIENFFLDPFYLVSLFLEMGNAHNVRDDLNFPEHYNQYTIGSGSVQRLQEVRRWVENKFKEEFKNEDMSARIDVEYLNGKRISLPECFLLENGHTLEGKFRKVFPALNSFKNNGELAEKLIGIMCKSYPFIPKESFQVLKKISTN